jgi:hypothetical protein
MDGSGLKGSVNFMDVGEFFHVKISRDPEESLHKFSILCSPIFWPPSFEYLSVSGLHNSCGHRIRG